MVRGFEFASSSDLLGVAVGEMLHLATVNKMLVAVDAAPNLVRQDFPYETDIYPFELNLEPLTRTTLARHVYAEASAEALDPAHPDNADPDKQEFLALLQTELGGVEPNRLGSMSTAWPTATLVHLPTYSSWLNQVEIYFSVLQRKAISPVDFTDLDALADRILAFQDRYNTNATPFDWTFTRTDLHALLDRFDSPLQPPRPRPPHDPRRTNELDH